VIAIVGLQNMHQDTFTSSSTDMQALVWSPPSNEDDGRVILYLHGAGGFGTGMAGLYEFPDFPSLLRDGMQLSSCVVILSRHVGERWEPSIISSFLDDFENFREKPKHGYDIVGYSRGGSGAYHFAATEPERIRTIAVVSTRQMPEAVLRISALPVSITHGINDPRTPASQAQLMHDALSVAGCKCQLSLVEGDHFIIAKVIADGHIFQWQRNAI
jgi:predicted esterase